MYIEVDDGLPAHPKSDALCDAIGNPLGWAHVIMLWSWCCRYAKDGDLSRYTTPQIEKGAGWKGEPGALLDAMVSAGFVERSGKKIRVHDWMNGQGKALAKMEKDKERKRRERLGHPSDGASDVQGTSDGHPRDGARTAQVPNLTIPNQDKPEEDGDAKPSPRPRFDFLAVYAKYPRRKGDPGKKDGLAVCERRVKTPEDFARLQRAVERYARERAADVGTEFIPKFSTWMNRGWEDFAEPAQPVLALVETSATDEAKRLEELARADAARYARLTQ